MNKLPSVLQELKEELKGLGLPASGIKADLVKRLEEALASSQTDEVMEAEAEDEQAEDVDEQAKVSSALNSIGLTEPAIVRVLTICRRRLASASQILGCTGLTLQGLQEEGVTTVTVEVEGDVAPEVVEAAAEAAVAAAEEVVEEETEEMEEDAEEETEAEETADIPGLATPAETPAAEEVVT